LIRWTFEVDTSALLPFTRQEYKERHLNDKETLRNLLEVSKVLDQESDYGLGGKFDNPQWMQLRGQTGTTSFDML